MLQRDRASSAVFFQFFLDFEPNTRPALLSSAVAKGVASHAERGTWDSSLVRELSEWDAFSEVLVGRVSVILGVKFAERLLIGMQRPVTTAVDDSTVPRTPRREWENCGNSLLFGRLSLNSLCVRAITVREEPNLHVDLTVICHRHDENLM